MEENHEKVLPDKPDIPGLVQNDQIQEHSDLTKNVEEVKPHDLVIGVEQNNDKLLESEKDISSAQSTPTSSSSSLSSTELTQKEKKSKKEKKREEREKKEEGTFGHTF